MLERSPALAKKREAAPAPALPALLAVAERGASPAAMARTAADLRGSCCLGVCQQRRDITGCSGDAGGAMLLRNLKMPLTSNLLIF